MSRENENFKEALKSSANINADGINKVKGIRQEILQATNFKTWFNEKDSSFYTPHEKLTIALYHSGRVHSSNWLKLYTYEKRYVQRMVNKSYGF